MQLQMSGKNKNCNLNHNPTTVSCDKRLAELGKEGCSPEGSGGILSSLALSPSASDSSYSLSKDVSQRCLAGTLENTALQELLTCQAHSCQPLVAGAQPDWTWSCTSGITAFTRTAASWCNLSESHAKDVFALCHKHALDLIVLGPVRETKTRGRRATEANHMRYRKRRNAVQTGRDAQTATHWTVGHRAETQIKGRE